MTTLIVEPLNSRGIAVSTKEILASKEDFLAWGIIKRDLLFYAYLNRPACLITVAPQTWSLGRELTDAPAVFINGKPYLLDFIKSCSAKLLADIATSEDFERGLLWLVSLNIEDKERVYSLVRTIEASGLNIPSISEETVFCVADGKILWWLNPQRPTHEIIPTLTTSASSVGWSIDSTALESSKDS